MPKSIKSVIFCCCMVSFSALIFWRDINHKFSYQHIYFHLYSANRKNLPDEIPERWTQPIQDIFDRIQTDVDNQTPLELMQYHDEVQVSKTLSNIVRMLFMHIPFILMISSNYFSCHFLGAALPAPAFCPHLHDALAISQFRSPLIKIKWLSHPQHTHTYTPPFLKSC